MTDFHVKTLEIVPLDLGYALTSASESTSMFIKEYLVILDDRNDLEFCCVKGKIRLLYNMRKGRRNNGLHYGIKESIDIALMFKITFYISLSH